jgi:Zinc finger, C2H2 type/Zinc-finger of C2H2 type
LQQQCYAIQQDLQSMYYKRAGCPEFVNVKLEDTSEDSPLVDVKIQCRKCSKSFCNLKQLTSHNECSKSRLKISKITNDFKSRVKYYGVEYDYDKFQDTFFTKNEKKIVEMRKKNETPRSKTKSDELSPISQDFMDFAKRNGIKYNISVFQRAFGYTEVEIDNINRRKLKRLSNVGMTKEQIRKIKKTKKEVSKEFLSMIKDEGVEINYDLSSFQRAFGYSDAVAFNEKYQGESSAIKCDSCDLELPNRTSYLHHLKSHKPKDIYCDKCDKEFKSKACLDLHLATDHERKKTGPFKCPQCIKTYNDRSAFRSHYYIHTTEKKYLCGVCGANFYHKKSFDMHLLIHDDIRPFECHICSKKFRNKGKLKIHLRVHTGERLYECPHCPGKRFRQKWGMDLHIKKTHKNEQKGNEYCNICGIQCQNRSKLKQHLISSHQVADGYD